MKQHVVRELTHRPFANLRVPGIEAKPKAKPIQYKSQHVQAKPLVRNHKEPANFDPTPCRAVSVILSRNKGIPISTSLFSGFGGSIPAEEALMGFGLIGVRKNGKGFARIGFYNFENGIPLFKYAVNFDMDDASPNFKPEQANRSTISESEMALTAWIQAGLFGNDIKEGHYFMKIDDVTNLAESDPERKEELRSQIATLPLRSEFAAERRVESAVEMWDRFLEMDPAGTGGIASPKRICLITQDQIPEQHFGPDGTVPLADVSIPTRMFRRYALNRFTAGLRVPNGQFREIRASFMQCFENLDQLVSKGARSMVMTTMLERMVTSVRAQAMKHIGSLDPARIKETEQIHDIEMALDAMRAYVNHRDRDGGVRMFLPPTTEQLQSEDKNISYAAMELNALFEYPMVNIIKAVPSVQISDSYMSTGDFPYCGFDLFARQ